MIRMIWFSRLALLFEFFEKQASDDCPAQPRGSGGCWYLADVPTVVGRPREL